LQVHLNVDLLAKLGGGPPAEKSGKPHHSKQKQRQGHSHNRGKLGRELGA
jgi:hypothetical protein